MENICILIWLITLFISMNIYSYLISFLESLSYTEATAVSQSINLKNAVHIWHHSRTIFFILLINWTFYYNSFVTYKLVSIVRLIPFSPQGRCSIVVSIPACHAGDPGSIPGNGAIFNFSRPNFQMMEKKNDIGVARTRTGDLQCVRLTW